MAGVALHRFHDPQSPSYIDASRWCITREDLDSFEKEVRQLWRNGGIPEDPDFPNKHHNDEMVGPTMYVVNECLIKPRTAQAGGMSWALMKHPGGLECDVFATHAWMEGVFEFVRRVRSAWPPGAEHLYVCFLANPQNGDISAMLKCDVLDSPFAKALKTAKSVLVIPNKNISIYLRLWCVLEAYIAVMATEDRGLVIKMPIAKDTGFLVQVITPGLLLLVAGFYMGNCVLNQMLGNYLGPLMWQLTALLFCSTLWLTGHALVQCVGCKVRSAAWFGVTVATLELFVVGIVSGIAVWQLQTFDHRKSSYRFDHDFDHAVTANTFQHGVHGPLILLTLSVIVLHVYQMILAIDNAVLKLENEKIRFNTVTEATCSSLEDELRIKQSLGTSTTTNTDMIDKAIGQLMQVGRYDRAVKFNLDRGMCYDSAREGLNLPQAVCACFLWSIWWMTDLAASLEKPTEESFGSAVADTHIIPIVVQASCALICAAIVHRVGERAIFAVATAFWFGIFFVCLTLTNYYWTKQFVIMKSMSGGTAGLQAYLFAIMLVVDVCFYSGFCAVHCGLGCEAGDRRVVDRNEAGDIEDDFARTPWRDFNSNRLGLPERFQRYGSFGSR